MGTGNQGLESSRITVQEIADRLNIGEMAVYQMLQAGMIPALRIGTGKGRWLITRRAFETWEATCGQKPTTLQ